MATLWFLQHLGLTAEADERCIKRAYAARLKQTDQGADLEGFSRLRQAYEMALRWRSQHGPIRQATTTLATAPIETTAETGPADGTEPPGPVTDTMRRAATPIAVDQPAVETGHAHREEQRDLAIDLTGLARAAMHRLVGQINTGQPAATALAAICDELRQGHVQLPMTFELMLIDGLAQATLPTRLALFHAARNIFGWTDIGHLAAMGPRGRWINAVTTEETDWNRQTSEWRGSQWFEWLEQGAVGVLNSALAAQWPRVAQQLQRFPNYLRLKVAATSLEAWHTAFNAMSPLDRDLAETYAGMSSPAAYRKAVPKPKRTGSPRGALAIAFVAFMGARMLVSMLGGATDALSASAHYTSAHTMTPSPRQTNIASLLRVEFPTFSHYSQVNSQTCSRLEQFIHGANWPPSLDDTQKVQLRGMVNACLRIRAWPHWQMADPRLAALGINT